MGGGLLEYALLAALVCVVSITAVNSIGGKIDDSMRESIDAWAASGNGPQQTGP